MDNLELTCQIQQDAFEAEPPFKLPKGLNLPAITGLSMQGGAFSERLQVAWTKTDLALQTLTGTLQMEKASVVLAHLTNGAADVLQVEHEGVTETTELSAAALVEGEWPWRLAALPFAIAYGSRQPLAFIDDAGHLQVVEAFIVVAGSEPLWTPAGNFITWKVTATYSLNGTETVLTAWYDVEAPHTLVRYHNGKVNYLLEKVE